MNIVKWTQQVSFGSVVAGTLVALTATAAFAYWTATGNGTGSASAATSAQPVTITQTTAITSWQPGEMRTVDGKFNNPNSYTVTVNRPTITGFSVDSGHSSCAASNFQVVSQPTSATTIDVAAGNGNGAWSGGQVQMIANPADGCKGATITVNYASS